MFPSLFSRPSPLISKEILAVSFGDLENENSARILKKTGSRLLEVMGERIGRLEAALHNKSRYDIEFAAHQLRGTFNMMGCTAIAHHCETIEKNAQVAPLDDLNGAFVEIQELLESFRDELSSILTELDNK